MSKTEVEVYVLVKSEVYVDLNKSTIALTQVESKGEYFKNECFSNQICTSLALPNVH